MLQDSGFEPKKMIDFKTTFCVKCLRGQVFNHKFRHLVQIFLGLLPFSAMLAELIKEDW